MAKKEYDDEGVYFCKECLSLKVMVGAVNGEVFDYCDECGSTSILEAPNIKRWQQLYFAKYGKEYLHIPNEKDFNIE